MLKRNRLLQSPIVERWVDVIPQYTASDASETAVDLWCFPRVDVRPWGRRRLIFRPWVGIREVQSWVLFYQPIHCMVARSEGGCNADSSRRYGHRMEFLQLVRQVIADPVPLRQRLVLVLPVTGSFEPPQGIGERIACCLSGSDEIPEKVLGRRLLLGGEGRILRVVGCLDSGGRLGSLGRGRGGQRRYRGWYTEAPGEWLESHGFLHPRHACVFAYLLLVPSTSTCSDKASSGFPPASSFDRSGTDSRSVFGLVFPAIVRLGRGWLAISGTKCFRSRISRCSSMK